MPKTVGRYPLPNALQNGFLSIYHFRHQQIAVLNTENRFLNPSSLMIVLAQLKTPLNCPVDLNTILVFNTSIGYIQVCAIAPAVAPAKNRCVLDGSAPQKLFLIVSKMPNLRPVSGKIFMTFTKFPRHSDLRPPSEYIYLNVLR